jgi:hypothetical protein
VTGTPPRPRPGGCDAAPDPDHASGRAVPAPVRFPARFHARKTDVPLGTGNIRQMSIAVIAPVTTGKGAGREDEAGPGKESGFFQEGTSGGKELSEGGICRPCGKMG